jgi:hypothetical protein
MFLRNNSLTLKLIDFGFARKWDQDLRAELFKQKNIKPVGSVQLLIYRFTICLLNALMVCIVKNMMFGRLVLPYM